MARHLSRRGTAAALVLAVVVVAVWGFLNLAPRPRATDDGARVLGAPDTSAARTVLLGRVPEERSPAPLGADPAAPVAGPAEPEVSPEVARTRARSAVDALVAELQRLDAEHPITFHEDAARVLEAFVASDGVASTGRTALVAALNEELDARGHAPRVGGSLLAVLGALGGPPQLFARLPFDDEELWRSALAGMAWDGAAPEAAAGFRLHPTEFFKLQPHGGLTVLDLDWDRLPAESERAWLRELARVPAKDFAALMQRELAVMALGLAADASADVLQQLRVWLMDRDALAQQVRPAIVYVLAHARSAEARDVLNRFLGDAQVGDFGKLLARWWISKQPAMEGDLKVLAAPLMDPDSTEDDRIMATGALQLRVADASESDLKQLEELLAMRVLQEQDAAARMLAVGVLEEVPGGFLRLGALEQALRGDPDARIRKVAARGLAETTGSMREEALAMLRAALSVESDPGLKEYMLQLIEMAGP